jgi:hypothetical protein
MNARQIHCVISSKKLTNPKKYEEMVMRRAHDNNSDDVIIVVMSLFFVFMLLFCRQLGHEYNNNESKLLSPVEESQDERDEPQIEQVRVRT